MLAAVASLAPVVLSMAIMRKSFVPGSSQFLDRKEQRTREPLGRLPGPY